MGHVAITCNIFVSVMEERPLKSQAGRAPGRIFLSYPGAHSRWLRTPVDSHSLGRDGNRQDWAGRRFKRLRDDPAKRMCPTSDPISVADLALAMTAGVLMICSPVVGYIVIVTLVVVALLLMKPVFLEVLGALLV